MESQHHQEGQSLMQEEDIDNHLKKHAPAEAEADTYEVTLAPHDANAEKEANRAKELNLKKQIDEITAQIESLNAQKETMLAELEKVSSVTTARNVRNQSILIARNYDNSKTRMMDVITEMKNGTQLLKYKRFGSAYHQFEITSDNKYLRWYSKNKFNISKTSILIESIEHLQKGHLYKSEASAGQHAYAFSITYIVPDTNEPKTLEVMAKDKTDFNVWTQGLDFILTTIRKIKKLKQKYDPKKHFPNNHFAEIEFLNQTKFEQKLAKREDPAKELFENDLKGIKTKYEEVLKQLNMVYNDDSYNSEKYDQIAIDSFNLIKERIKELKIEIARIDSHFEKRTKKTSILVYRVAWIATELNTLDEKIFVLHNSYSGSASPVSRLKTFFMKK